MEKYIPKSALVAEINKRITDSPINYIGHQRVWAYNDVKDIINTLEVKEEDLEKEIELVKGDYEQVDVAWNNDFGYIAKHFFEIGLKAKGEIF